MNNAPKKSSDDSSILDSSSANNKNSPLIPILPNGANGFMPPSPNFYAPPPNAMPLHLAGQMAPPPPPQGPPGPGYFFYPANQAAYFSAYYANNPNHPGNFGYPGIPSMLPHSAVPQHFYPGI